MGLGELTSSCARAEPIPELRGWAPSAGLHPGGGPPRGCSPGCQHSPRLLGCLRLIKDKKMQNKTREGVIKTKGGEDTPWRRAPHSPPGVFIFDGGLR